MPRDNWDPALEEKYGRELAGIIMPVMDDLKAKFPEGIHFGIIVEIPASVAGEEGRAIVMSTDRARVGRAAAQWIVNAKPFSA